MTALEVLQKIGNILFGHADQVTFVLIALVIIDYITGTCVAIHDKKLSSKVGLKGVTKKIAIFALVALSHIIDEHVLHSNDTVATVTIIFYSSNECLSIIENVGKLGIPLPQKLKEILSCFENISKDK